MGLVSFISKGRKIVFQAKTRSRRVPVTRRKVKLAPKSPFSRSQELSRIGQAEQAIKNAKNAGIPFSKKQERQLRITAITGKAPRSSRSRSRVINNNSDLNVS